MAPMNNRLMRPRASGFNPKSISGLSLWLDASDTSTLGPTSDGVGTVTANGPVKYWGDKSGNGFHVIRTTADSTAPSFVANHYSGKSALSFDGVDDGIINTTARINLTGQTLFVALNRGNITNRVAFTFFPASGNDDTTTGGLVLNVTNSYSGGAGGNILILNPPATVEGQNNVIILNFATTNSAIHYTRANGATSSVSDTSYTASDQSTGFGISSRFLSGSPANSSPYKGTVMEILQYNRSLSATDQATVLGYLQKKWGVS